MEHTVCLSCTKLRAREPAGRSIGLGVSETVIAVMKYVTGIVCSSERCHSQLVLRCRVISSPLSHSLQSVLQAHCFLIAHSILVEVGNGGEEK